jgi:hypothetical protein
LRVYRSAFLLNRLNNSAFGKLYIPAGKCLLVVFFINVPAFAVFCFWDQLDVISISAFCSVAAAVGPVIFTCSSVMSKIYGISSQFQRNMEQKIQASGNKAMRNEWIRELRSCQVVRVQIGNFYHMEGKAKLTIVNTMVNWFVFMVVQQKLQ